jgi:hypothetical protein
VQSEFARAACIQQSLDGRLQKVEKTHNEASSGYVREVGVGEYRQAISKTTDCCFWLSCLRFLFLAPTLSPRALNALKKRVKAMWLRSGIVEVVVVVITANSRHK